MDTAPDGMELPHLNLHLLGGGEGRPPTLGEGDDTLDVDGEPLAQGGGEAHHPRGHHPVVGAGGVDHAPHRACWRS